ncbi:TPA: hypothetical protein ACIQN7_002608 [Bacillus cereus]|uniref:Uncharacterized protein n=1 Tax=Bacillus cereus TaxID=1396 RepID=A0A9X6UIK8_BACCE|nr:hypothetical protein [Bacillus cereus]PEQ83485.1 hypothetical protein CN475_23470 [Bacillus cereus]
MTNIDKLVTLTWDIFNMSGDYHDFKILQLNTGGSFTGKFSGRDINGLYNENSGNITFEYIPSVIYKVEFNGYIFIDSTNSDMFTMAGLYKIVSIQMVPKTGNENAFFAQINL